MSHRTPHATRASVIAAIAECDRLGVDAFLAAHGFQPSRRYQLRHRGRSYPSKAILGVAAGLTAREFSGGAAHTARVLGRLGFQVRDGRPAEVPAEVRELVGSELGAFPFAPWTAGRVDPVAYFASGCNTAANIAAFAAVGHDVGVAFPELRESGIAALLELAGSDVAAFVDSGAFSEVTVDADGPHIVAPLSDDYWRRYLATCRELAAVLGGQLFVVAPDMVGHQAETLDRLGRFVDDLRDLDRLGARVLVPVQRGELSQADFWRAELELLGDGAWIPALPCAKSATPPADVVAFAAEVQPRALHLLGLGSRNRQAARIFDGIDYVAAGCRVSLDSCLLTAHCGADRRYGYARRRGLELLGSAPVAVRTAFQVALAFGAIGAVG